MVPFDWRVPADDRDGGLGRKLREELPGILAWAVAGAVEWHGQGLNPPPEVEYVTREYVDEQNHLPAFVRDCYTLDPTGIVTGGDLHKEYLGWCANRGEQPFDYQRKVVPFLRNVMKLAPHDTEDLADAKKLATEQLVSIEQRKDAAADVPPVLNVMETYETVLRDLRNLDEPTAAQDVSDIQSRIKKNALIANMKAFQPNLSLVSFGR